MITVRPYEEGDWHAVCRVHDRARPEELRGSCDPRAFVPLSEDAEYEQDFHRSNKLVACEGERVVGFVSVDGDYISWLYIDPEQQGRGIGRRLLRHAVSLAGPTASTVTLANNERALRLYLSEGFRIAETFEGENAGFPCTCVRLELQARQR